MSLPSATGAGAALTGTGTGTGAGITVVSGRDVPRIFANAGTAARRSALTYFASSASNELRVGASMRSDAYACASRSAFTTFSADTRASATSALRSLAIAAQMCAVSYCGRSSSIPNAAIRNCCDASFQFPCFAFVKPRSKSDV